MCTSIKEYYILMYVIYPSLSTYICMYHDHVCLSIYVSSICMYNVPMNETCQSRCVSAITKLPLYFLIKNVMIERQPAWIRIVIKPVEKLKYVELRIFNKFSTGTRVFLTWCDVSHQRSPPCLQEKTPGPLRQSIVSSWRGKNYFYLACTFICIYMYTTFTFSYKVGGLFFGKYPWRQSWGRRN